MQDFKVSLSSNWRFFLYTLLDKIPHKFSIGFKSGDLVSQSKISIFFCFKPVFRELRCLVLLKNLIDPLIGTKQLIQFRVIVGLGVMTMKVYSTLPRAQKLKSTIKCSLVSYSKTPHFWKRFYSQGKPTIRLFLAHPARKSTMDSIQSPQWPL